MAVRGFAIMAESLVFLDVGGHALYVWGTYAVGLALLLVEVVLLLLRKRTILGHLGWRKRGSRSNAAIKQRRVSP